MAGSPPPRPGGCGMRRARSGLRGADRRDRLVSRALDDRARRRGRGRRRGGGDRPPRRRGPRPAGDHSRRRPRRGGFRRPSTPICVRPECRTGYATCALAHSMRWAVLAGDVDLLYVDGAHRFAARAGATSSNGALGSPPGGRCSMHDSFNAVGVTLAQLRLLVFSSRWAIAAAPGSLAEYRRESAGVRGAGDQRAPPARGPAVLRPQRRGQGVAAGAAASADRAARSSGRRLAVLAGSPASSRSAAPRRMRRPRGTGQSRPPGRP